VKGEGGSAGKGGLSLSTKKKLRRRISGSRKGKKGKRRHEASVSFLHSEPQKLAIGSNGWTRDSSGKEQHETLRGSSAGKDNSTYDVFQEAA